MQPQADEDKAMRLLVGGPALCMVCGRTFTRGGAFDVPELLMSPGLCQWCLAAWLENITGWRIVDQMRGWLVSRMPAHRTEWAESGPLEDYDHSAGCDATG